MNTIQKLILKHCPTYDFEQYHYEFGDIVETLDGAKIFVTKSLLTEVDAYVLRSSFKYRRYKFARVPYTELPYYTKGSFRSEELPLCKSLRWRVGTVVHDEQYDNYILLTEERDGGFVGLVVGPQSSYYYGTSVWVMNPYREYIMQ